MQRSRACKVSRMESQPSRPADRGRSLTNHRMQFRLSTLLLAVTMTAVFIWMNVGSYVPPEQWFASTGAPLRHVYSPGYGWPLQCVDVVSTIAEPSEHSIQQDAKDLNRFVITSEYHLRPRRLALDAVALCLSVLLATKIASLMKRKKAKQRTMACTRSTA